jgi:CRISPR/Cas system-associated exonuclease Cas4 (RecB family)
MALRNDFDWLTLPSPEAQALGTVSHLLSEEVDSGAFDHEPDERLFDAVVARWNELIQSSYEQMKKESLFGAPAAPKRWPFYVIKQSSAIERAMVRRQMRGHGGGARRPSVEVNLESNEFALVGRADKIEYLGDDVRIVDLKTAENPGGTIPLAYRFQLFLYALMWREMTGKSPVSVAIEWQDGTRSYCVIDDNEVDLIAAELSRARAWLSSTTAPQGSVNEDICRYCSYRSLCPQFLAFEREGWVRQSPLVLGYVERIVQAHQTRTLVIRTTESQPPQLQWAVVHRFPATEIVVEGDFVIFDRLSWRGGDGNFDVVWNSRYRNFGSEFPEALQDVVNQSKKMDE